MSLTGAKNHVYLNRRELIPNARTVAVKFCHEVLREVLNYCPCRSVSKLFQK